MDTSGISGGAASANTSTRSSEEANAKNLKSQDRSQQNEEIRNSARQSRAAPPSGSETSPESSKPKQSDDVAREISSRLANTQPLPETSDQATAPAKEVSKKVAAPDTRQQVEDSQKSADGATKDDSDRVQL